MSIRALRPFATDIRRSAYARCRPWTYVPGRRLRSFAISRPGPTGPPGVEGGLVNGTATGRHAVVVGGGLGGVTAAVALTRVGARVTFVIASARRMRATPATSKRAGEKHPLCGSHAPDGDRTSWT
jgi:hypothetical protein